MKENRIRIKSNYGAFKRTTRSQIDSVGKSFFENIDKADQLIIQRVG